MNTPIKTITCAAMVSIFALLCLSNCSDSEPSKPSSGTNLSVKCQEHTGAKKSLVGAAEVYEEEFAVLTNSNGKTHIYLAEIGLNCAAQDPKIFSINHAVDFDTLKLVGKYDVLANCGCTSSLDLTIESVGNDIKYLAYSNYGEDFTQIFPVRYKGKELKQP